MRPHRRGRAEVASHTDDWLMTYADMITLLLCFFALFVSVSLTQKSMPHPVTVTQSIPLPPSPPPQAAPVERLADKAAAEPFKPEVPPAAAVATSAPKPDALPVATSATPRAKPPPAPKPEPPAAAAAPEPLPTSPPATTDPPQPAPVVTPVMLTLPRPADPPAGDRISTLEMSSAAFFDSGSATLTAAGEAILLPLAAKLQSDEHRDYRITVEGHTDDNPIHTAQFPSNWELSTARAAAVVHYFLEQGLPAQRLRAVGYGSTEPKAPDRDADGKPIPENQAQNRRVVIRLEKIEKQESPATITAAFFPPPELQ